MQHEAQAVMQVSKLLAVADPGSKQLACIRPQAIPRCQPPQGTPRPSINHALQRQAAARQDRMSAAALALLQTAEKT